jgi:hypothetical protein
MMGLEGSDPETIECVCPRLTSPRVRANNCSRSRRPTTIGPRYEAILSTKRLQLAGTTTIKYDMDRDMLWRNEPLPTHPNGMRSVFFSRGTTFPHAFARRFSVYSESGDLMATNEYFSVRFVLLLALLPCSPSPPSQVGGGFVVNEQTQGEPRPFPPSILPNSSLC